MGRMGFVGLGDFLDAAAYLGVAVVEGFEGGGVALVMTGVQYHVLGRAVEDGGAGDGIVACVDAEVLAEHGASPGEGAAAAAAHKVGARNAPDLADDADDLAGEFVVDVSGGCGHGFSS